MRLENSGAKIVLVCSDVAGERAGLYTRAVLGVPLFVRSCLTLANEGFTQFAIVAPAGMRRSILKIWQRYAAPRGLALDFIPLGVKENAHQVSVGHLARTVAPRFCVLDGATVVTAHWVKTALQPGLRFGRAIPGAIGCFVRETLSEHLLAALVTVAEDIHPTLRAGDYCRIVYRHEVPMLEHFLCENIRLSANGVIAKQVNKRISLPISRTLARLRISPNAITVFNMLIGLAAGIGTAGVTYFGLLMGGTLFQLASILDGCDGEVAKLTFRTSKFGQVIDTVSDNFALASFFIGLSIHLVRVTGNPLLLSWAVLLFSGGAILVVTIFRFVKTHADSASLATIDREFIEPWSRNLTTVQRECLRAGKALLKKEWFSLGFFLLSIFGVLPAALYLATLGSWGGVIGVLLLRTPLLEAKARERAPLLDLPATTFAPHTAAQEA